MAEYSVYMLKCSDGSIYTGCTVDLPRRLRQHGEGKGSKYTRSRRPVVLAYFETAADRSSAQRREAYLKRLKRTEKQDLCASFKAKHLPSSR